MALMSFHAVATKDASCHLGGPSPTPPEGHAQRSLPVSEVAGESHSDMKRPQKKKKKSSFSYTRRAK